MPKIKQNLSKIGHPNSRKTAALVRQVKRKQDRQKTKLAHVCLENLTGEKLMWFKEHLVPDVRVYLAEETEKIIAEYMARFNEELKQINIKQSIGKRKNRQYASREDIIKLTLKKEAEEYNTCGIEVPDLWDETQLNLLRTWGGELKYLQKFKLRRIGKRHILDKIHIEKRYAKQNKSNPQQTPGTMECE
ncbi:hypothetical protein MML48_2g00009185 [Holotrichia oblita]|uniref:Uncharacterized protein n=1 Tax=Holotrichia oblita TaxID=644536 RepID=A0ACB9TL94_HOLOL|nr:hypothetical protein MML48_2g00009185 [Holotrichia oblita]